MAKENPFKGIPKTKIIRGEYYRLYNDCFRSAEMLQSELNHLRSAGYSAYRYKEGNWWFIYIRRK